MPSRLRPLPRQLARVRRSRPRTRYQHIDALFGDNAIDWDLIEKHWTDLLRTAISIRERVSSVTLLGRLGNHSQ